MKLPAKNSVWFFVLWYCAASLILSPPDSYAQQSIPALQKNPLHVHFINMPSRQQDKGTAVIVIQIDYDNLRFLKEGDAFTARYDISIEILDENNKIVKRRYWSEEIKLADFTQTINSQHELIKPVSFTISPGFYRYVVQMTDVDSHKTLQRKGSKFFPSYWDDRIGISDILFTRTTESDTTLLTFLSPDEAIKADYTEGFSAQFQIFSADEKPVRLVWKLYDFQDESAPVHGDSATYAIEDNILDINIPFTGMSFQPTIYLLRATAYLPDGTHKERLIRFNFTWVNRPLSSYDIPQAIMQMKYIFNEDEADKVKDMDDDEKRAFFLSYWKSRDLTPETGVNELMEEYFRRVEYANQNFSYGTKEGWESDRGRIYCLYGNPDNREKRNTLDMRSPPREIWTYYTVRKEFIFVDRNRSGQFPLVAESVIQR